MTDLKAAAECEQKNKVSFNVKDKSVYDFFYTRVLEDERLFTKELNPYCFMRDELFFKKNCDIKVGEIVRMELSDTSRLSKKELINVYLYKAEEYDDVSIKLILIDFKVELLTTTH